MKNSQLTDFDYSEVQAPNQPDGEEGLLDAYRHDAHKMNGEKHDSAPITFRGVSVNQTVPRGADGDAAKLSRPNGKPKQTVENHDTHYRLSLLLGESRYDPGTFSRRHIDRAVEELLTEPDTEEMHRRWLNSTTASAFNESVYCPYTSLKYHTLLVVALYDNYESGTVFSDLRLIVDPAGDITPHRTIYAGDSFTLRIGPDSNGRPSARLGSRPWQSWASAWSRLTDHPLDTDTDRRAMFLDSNLRRIGSWSTALQYIEDFDEVLLA